MDKRHGHGGHHHHHCRCRYWKYPVVMNCAMVATELDDIGKRANDLVINAYSFKSSALVMCYPKTCKSMIYGKGLVEKEIEVVLNSVDLLTLRTYALAKVVRKSCGKKLDIWYVGYSCLCISKKIEAIGYQAEKLSWMLQALLRKVRKGEATPCYIAWYTDMLIEKGKELVNQMMELATKVKLSCRCKSGGCW